MGKQMIFDGHNDALMRLWKHQGDPVAHFATDAGHVNAAACRAGGMGGGFFAIYSPASRAPHAGNTEVTAIELEPLDDPLDQGWALQAAMGQAGIALQLANAGQIEIVTQPDQLARAFMGDAQIASTPICWRWMCCMVSACGRWGRSGRATTSLATACPLATSVILIKARA